MLNNQTNFPDDVAQQSTETCDSLPELVATSISGTSIPDLPILPTTLVHLENLLNADVVDLAALTDVVRSDLGLTVYLIRIARSADFASATIPRISEIIVCLGINHLRAIVHRIPVLRAQTSSPGVRACNRFWMHAQLTGLIAEELASHSTNLNGDDAYLAGLVCQIGRLSRLLGWRIPEFENGDTAALGGTLARAWGFPNILREVIDGDDKPTSSEAQSLRHVVASARDWVQLLELVTDGNPVLR
jgi:HD-like signal output (HDOD) protein